MSDLPYIDDAVSIKKKIEYMKDSNDFNSVNVDWLVRTVEYQQQEIERLRHSEKTLGDALHLCAVSQEQLKQENERLKKEKSFHQNRVKYLESMIDNGLGWDDVKTE